MIFDRRWYVIWISWREKISIRTSTTSLGNDSENLRCTVAYHDNNIIFIYCPALLECSLMIYICLKRLLQAGIFTATYIPRCSGNAFSWKDLLINQFKKIYIRAVWYCQNRNNLSLSWEGLFRTTFCHDATCADSQRENIICQCCHSWYWKDKCEMRGGFHLKWWHWGSWTGNLQNPPLIIPTIVELKL